MPKPSSSPRSSDYLEALTQEIEKKLQRVRFCSLLSGIVFASEFMFVLLQNEGEMEGI